MKKNYSNNFLSGSMKKLLKCQYKEHIKIIEVFTDIFQCNINKLTK